MVFIVVADCKNSSGNNSVTITANTNEPAQAAAANKIPFLISLAIFSR